jgi:hypothetical protein
VTLIMGQATVPTGKTVPIFTVPAAPCNVVFWNPGTSITYVGASTLGASPVLGATAASLQCHAVPTSFEGFLSSRQTTFYATAIAATAQVNYIISTDQ